MTLPNFEQIQAEGQKTLARFLGFSKRTGIDPTHIQDTSPIKKIGIRDGDKEILQRLVKQTHLEANSNKTTVENIWEKIIPKDKAQESQYSLQIALDLAAEFLTGGKFKSTGALGETLSKWGARIAVGLELEGDLGLCMKNSRYQLPKLQLDIRELEKTGGPLQKNNPLNPPNKSEFQNLLDLIDTIVEEAFCETKQLKKWVANRMERTFGTKDILPPQIGVAANWLVNLPLAGQVALTAIPLAASTSAPVSVPIALLGALVIHQIQKKTQSMPNPETWQTRLAALEEEHGKPFEADAPFWREKIEAELQNAGLNPPNLPKPKGPPTNDLLLIQPNPKADEKTTSELYQKLIPELAKRGFHTLSLDIPQDTPNKKTLEKIYTETLAQPAQELPNFIENPLALAYCLGKRHNMEVILTDLPNKTLDKNITALQKKQLELGSSGEFDPKHITSLWGGPQGYIESQHATHHYYQTRATHQAQILQQATRKGRVAHLASQPPIGEFLQKTLDSLTKTCPSLLNASPENFKALKNTITKDPQENPQKALGYAQK